MTKQADFRASFTDRTKNSAHSTGGADDIVVFLIFARCSEKFVSIVFSRSVGVPSSKPSTSTFPTFFF